MEYSVKKTKQLLELIQELYQQKVISKKSKNALVQEIKKSFTTRHFIEVDLLWSMTPCLIEEKRDLFDEFNIILNGGN
jgi:hypothetical protein